MDILVAVDGSEEADDALAHAAEMADATGGSITVVHAVDPSIYDTGGSDPITSLSDADRRLVMESVEDAENRGMEVVEEAAALVADRGHDVTTELVYGDPATAIPDYAETAGFDAIFVGHRGRSERAGQMVGSVATAIVERASVPVTVVR
jgi:nucleotide-binding universal stress UspA family protein